MTDQTPTPRTDGEDRWQVDKDELGLHCRETVRIDFARELERENAALRAALAEISEYWNGSRNDSAMYDALNHIDEVAARALVEPE
jgi:hypothetical protein